MTERSPVLPPEVVERSFKKKGPKQYTLWVDLEYCIGCHSCTMACKQENNTLLGQDFNRVIEVEVGEFKDARKKPDNLRVYFVAMPCMHCGKPACMAACPVGAITKRKEDGIVLVNKDKCIGCRYCSWACPYGAPQFNEEARVMEKCTLCVHRVSEGLLPACVETCIAKTRFFGEVNYLTDTIRKKQAKRSVMGVTGTIPSVIYTK